MGNDRYENRAAGFTPDAVLTDVEIAMEYLPEKFKVHQIRVEYKHPAFYKDILVPKRQIADGRVTILLENSEGQVCVAAEFAE